MTGSVSRASVSTPDRMLTPMPRKVTKKPESVRAKRQKDKDRHDKWS